MLEKLKVKKQELKVNKENIVVCILCSWEMLSYT